MEPERAGGQRYLLFAGRKLDDETLAPAPALADASVWRETQDTLDRSWHSGTHRGRVLAPPMGSESVAAGTRDH